MVLVTTQAGRHAVKPKGRQACSQTERQADMQSNRKVGRHAVKPKGRQTCSQTERQTETDGETSRLMYSNEKTGRRLNIQKVRVFFSSAY